MNIFVHICLDKCYTLLQTGMVMFDQVDLGNLMSYQDKVKGYSDRYGVGVWHLIYQCEVRTRLEHFERIRRQGQVLLADALLVNPALDKSTFSFQEDRPWNYVWKTVVEDTPWWRETLEEPCLLVLARAANLASKLGNDAPIDTGDGPAHKRPRTVSSTSDSRANVIRDKHHNITADGSEYRTNRSGYARMHVCMTR